MASSFSPNLNLELISTGEQTDTWGATLNTNDFSIVDLAMGGRLSTNVGGSGDITLSDSDARNFSQTFTGVLTGNINVIFPNRGRFYYCYNNTSGAFSLTVKALGGTGIAIPTGARGFVFLNPTSGAAEFLSSIFAITQIATAIKTGADTQLVTGTAGTSGHLASWNVDGDTVDSGLVTSTVYFSGGTDVAIADGGTGASDAATARTNLGLGTASNPQFATIELGAATDTTLSRASAGNLAVEGNLVYRAGGTDVPVADGGTGASTLTGLLQGNGTSAITGGATVNNGSWSGTALAIGNGGTGATTAATAATALGLGTASNPQFATIELGAATDTTLARVSAGNVSVEGNLIYRAGGTDVPLTDGGTGASDASGARANLGVSIGTDVLAVATSGQLPVGYSACMNYTGTSVSNGATTAGTNVRTVIMNGSNPQEDTGLVQTGTWINESGITLQGSVTMFGQMRRTA